VKDTQGIIIQDFEAVPTVKDTQGIIIQDFEAVPTVKDTQGIIIQDFGRSSLGKRNSINTKKVSRLRCA
jgi:hypothetical protein